MRGLLSKIENLYPTTYLYPLSKLSQLTGSVIIFIHLLYSLHDFSMFLLYIAHPLEDVAHVMEVIITPGNIIIIENQDRRMCHLYILVPSGDACAMICPTLSSSLSPSINHSLAHLNPSFLRLPK